MSSAIHSVVFLKGWTEAAAKKWLKEHDLKPIKAVHKVIRKADGVMSQMRYRIIHPSEFRRFITKKVKHGNKYINIVIGFY